MKKIAILAIAGQMFGAYALPGGGVAHAQTGAGTVTGKPSSICAGGTTTYQSNGDAGTFSSSDPAVATVNPTTGVITGVSPGTATITYTVTGTKLTATKTVTVCPNLNPGPTANPSILHSVCIGESFTVSGNRDPGGTFASNDTNVVTVDPTTGVVTGVHVGITSITYTLTNCCGRIFTATTTNVNVCPDYNPGTITGEPSAICPGGKTTYRTINGGVAGGIFTSSDTSVASVDHPFNGWITGVNPGTATITYTTPANCCGKTFTATKEITVCANPDPGTITGPSTLCIGASATYVTNGSAGGRFISGNPSVATVDPTTGVVTAIGGGTVAIFYAIDNCCHQQFASGTTVTVDPNRYTCHGMIISVQAELCKARDGVSICDLTLGGDELCQKVLDRNCIDCDRTLCFPEEEFPYRVFADLPVRVSLVAKDKVTGISRILSTSNRFQSQCFVPTLGKGALSKSEKLSLKFEFEKKPSKRDKLILYRVKSAPQIDPPTVR